MGEAVGAASGAAVGTPTVGVNVGKLLDAAEGIKGRVGFRVNGTTVGDALGGGGGVGEAVGR